MEARYRQKERHYIKRLEKCPLANDLKIWVINYLIKRKTAETIRIWNDLSKIWQLCCLAIDVQVLGAVRADLIEKENEPIRREIEKILRKIEEEEVYLDVESRR